MDVRIRNIIFLNVRRIVTGSRSEGRERRMKGNGEVLPPPLVKKNSRFQSHNFQQSRLALISYPSVHSLWKNSRKIGVNRRGTCALLRFSSSMLGCVSERIIFLNEVSFFFFSRRNDSEVVRIAFSSRNATLQVIFFFWSINNWCL